jgi:hypothetical protein
MAGDSKQDHRLWCGSGNHDEQVGFCGLSLRFRFDGQGLKVQMFAIYECAACVLAVWIGMTLLFLGCVMFLVLIEGCTILVQTLRKVTYGEIPLIGRWLTVGSRES